MLLEGLGTRDQGKTPNGENIADLAEKLFKDELFEDLRNNMVGSNEESSKPAEKFSDGNGLNDVVIGLKIGEDYQEDKNGEKRWASRLLHLLPEPDGE